jgi:hypothetical protein
MSSNPAQITTLKDLCQEPSCTPSPFGKVDRAKRETEKVPPPRARHHTTPSPLPPAGEDANPAKAGRAGEGSGKPKTTHPKPVIPAKAGTPLWEAGI